MQADRHTKSRAARPEPVSPARSDRGERSGKEDAAGAGRAVSPGPATVHVVPDGHRVRMTVRGELDLGAQHIRYELQAALRGSAEGVDLDLSAVSFCDCSGLNLLLDARQRALRQGKTVAIRASSPAVERLLGLVGAQDLFAGGTANTPATRSTGNRGREPREGEPFPHGEVLPLRQAVWSRRRTPAVEPNAGRPAAATPERVPAGSG